jgi:hypothetical protein
MELGLGGGVSCKEQFTDNIHRNLSQEMWDFDTFLYLYIVNHKENREPIVAMLISSIASIIVA